MISVTDEAGDLLTRLIDQAGMHSDEGEAFRVVRDRRGDVGLLMPDTKGETDVPVVFHDRTVLLLTAPVAAELDGGTLDVAHGKAGRAGLVWRGRSQALADDRERLTPTTTVVAGSDALAAHR